MAVCDFTGNSDMYGLGIRLGYYLQYFGVIFASWMARSEVKGLCFSRDVFVAASFLALIILTVRDVNSLEPVEAYIVLLLMFGGYLALVPTYIWRICTACDPYWDPTRYPIVKSSKLTAELDFILLVSVLVYQYWFWFARVPSLDKRNCQQYGFLFGQVRLNSKAAVIVNILLYAFLGLIWLYLLALKIQKLLHPEPKRRPRTKPRPRTRARDPHRDLLQNIDGWIRLVIAAIVTFATELTVQWNEIQGVNTLASTGQTIPFVIGLASGVRILYIYFYKGDDEKEYQDNEIDNGPLDKGQLPPRQSANPFAHRDAPSVHPSDPDGNP